MTEVYAFLFLISILQVSLAGGSIPDRGGYFLAYLALKIKREAYEITMLYVCVCPVNDF
jgi:hypothetical protein